ncbi:Norsolorinic acid ketoreductase [Lachnellula occidentalis]|uniref:Norsolorinic acid ketoreductase n=1 Tax=Lachnellula occidentalis TaxID=215460 RepID=A0A8H8RWB4_9HELO|nr:Norsolorinic acid ketoreductase [Lachnellula occidentalis]
MSALTYVITGANRGIGKGLLETLVLRPQTTVVAAVRDVASSEKTLSSVPVGSGSKIIVIKVDSTSATDASEAVQELKSKHGISKVDVLISNAGLLDPADIAPTLKASVNSVRKHLEVNTLGPLVLIQAFFPLLEVASEPKFLVITSSIGSIKLLEDYQVPFFTYGISKAAANYLVRKLHFENPKLTSMAFNPGWVQTDMGSGAAKSVGMEDAPVTLENSVKGLVTQFDAASREKSGMFISQEGESIPW